MPPGPAVALVVALAAALGWAGTATPAAAQEPAAPVTCQVGAYLITVTAFDPEADTFDADLWLWSVCPNGTRRPLETMEFVNAEEIAERLASEVPVGSAVWSQHKVRGTFRHDWDERAYPFDHHTLEIVLEEGVEDAAHFRYEPDTADTAYDPALRLPGWTITGFALTPSLAHYPTDFGDPAQSTGTGSDYSRLTLVIELARADLASFFKLTAVVYAAFVLSLGAYVMHLESPNILGAQLGLLAGALLRGGRQLADGQRGAEQRQRPDARRRHPHRRLALHPGRLRGHRGGTSAGGTRVAAGADSAPELPGRGHRRRLVPRHQRGPDRPRRAGGVSPATGELAPRPYRELPCAGLRMLCGINIHYPHLRSRLSL